MANEEHLKILGQGVEAWNAWRQEYFYLRIDLAGSDFRKSDLAGADLSEADLTEADLTGGNLEGAKLYRAHLEGAKLREAKLKRAQLNEANFCMTVLTEADLREANLVKTSLVGANFVRAELYGANLEEANLEWANLRDANLVGANLVGAKLYLANLKGANLEGAKLRGARLYETTFNDVDLSNAEGLEFCRHLGPSCIDYRTLAQSKGVPLSFWRGCGLPDTLIEYLPSLIGDAIQFYTCFISYSSKDQEFADRLHADLQNAGVRCWFAPHDLPIGKKILDGLDEAIRMRDKVLLILSERAIASDWVEDEVTTAYEEERRRKEIILFPLRLDAAVLETSEPWAGKLRSRNIGDFTKWKRHDAYKATLERVLRDLRVER